MNNVEYKEILEKGLAGCFDIEYDQNVCGEQFEMVADFYMRNSKTLLVSNTELYAFQNNERIFYNAIDSNFTADDVSLYREFVEKNVEEIVDVDDDHMSTLITFLFYTDSTPSEEVLKAVRKFRFHKSFKLGFKGWVDARIFIVNPSEKKVWSNRLGRKDAQKFLFSQTNISK